MYDQVAVDYFQFTSLTNFITHDTALKFVESEAKTRCTFKGNQGGGCLEKGSLVQLSTGDLRKIQDIKTGDYVYSIDENYKIIKSKVTNVIDSGIKPLTVISTKNGRYISATSCHPFLTIDGWKQLSDIKVGDHIAVPRQIPFQQKSTNKYDLWVYKMLGYLIGDGCIISHIGFSNLDKNIISEIKDILPDTLNLVHVNRGDYRIVGNGKPKSNDLINIIKDEALFGKNSYTKFVPEFVFLSTKEYMGAFLSRLFSCDGWVDKRSIGYASVSKQLMFDIQTLLLKFGILSRIRAKKNNNWGTNSIRTDDRIDYILTIQRFSDIKIFSEQIGIFSKQNKLNALIKAKNKIVAKENSDTIPIDINYLKDKIPKISKKNNIKGTNWVYQDNNLYKIYRQARGKTVTREKALMLGFVFNSTKLKNLSCSDVLWDKVTDITFIGKKQCYDLTVENSHNFIANNIFAHNTSSHMYDLTLRLLGLHPVEWRNRINAPIRLISKVQPKGSDDIQNQQYVELKKLLPYEQIKRDITTHPPAVMTIKNPTGAGKDYVVELMSSQQEIDAFMSVQRQALYIDEELEKMKYDENQIRLLAMDGDTNISLTPVRGLDWTYDVLWKRAKTIFRSKTICNKYGFPGIENTENNTDIECFCWATDDNPALSIDTIERLFENIVDEDDLAMRRYGVFKQASGQMYKGFSINTHKISVEKYWDPVLFSTYWHFRIIDYHPTKPWYISWVAVTPQNEWFVWQEWKASHDLVTTLDLRDTIKKKSLVDEDSELNRKTLIDPLAKQKQPNTGFSMFDDISRGEYGLRRIQAADTKNEQGRMNIKHRLKNAASCEVPFNNKRKDGKIDARFGDCLPTLWFFANCRGHVDHFSNWRTTDYKTEEARSTHDDKKITQKWSDYCRNLEFLGALNPAYYRAVDDVYTPPKLFSGRVR